MRHGILVSQREAEDALATIMRENVTAFAQEAGDEGAEYAEVNYTPAPLSAMGDVLGGVHGELIVTLSTGQQLLISIERL
jgi:hypothetical protein